MIVVKLIGGLGNQMFQYAAGRSLAMLHKTELYLDTSYLDLDPDGAYTIRHFELGKFKIHAQIADKEILRSFKLNTSRYIIKARSFFPSFFERLVFNESQQFFHRQFFKLPATTYLNGYWQNEKYFLSLKDLLIQEFDLQEKSQAYDAMLKEIRSKNPVSIHVRHGDYMTLGTANKFHGVLPLTYYIDAANYFDALKEDFVFFVFSDDLNWCRENLSFIKNARFVDGKKMNLSAQEELLLMSQCNHNIVANSSFSWWAAWLNNNKTKKVIAPKYWYNKAIEQPEELVPPGWIRL